MKDDPAQRAIEMGQYIASTGATVRTTASKFGISKSSVHKDITERLRHLSPQLYRTVRLVLEKNKAERHIRGGLATRRKFHPEQ